MRTLQRARRSEIPSGGWQPRALRLLRLPGNTREIQSHPPELATPTAKSLKPRAQTRSGPRYEIALVAAMNVARGSKPIDA